MLKGILTLLLFQLAGEVISAYWKLSVSGPIVGMILLFIALMVRNGPSADLAACSTTLIKYLPLLFLPAGVGIFFLPGNFSNQWPAILAAMFLGTTIAIVITASLMKFCLKISGLQTPERRD